MSPARRPPGERLVTDAFLLRRVDHGESDLIVTFFSEVRGLIPAVARAARKSARRFGLLEPIHLLRVTLEDRPNVELATLLEAQIARPHTNILAALDRMEASGRALQWVRIASPPRVPEPRLWADLSAFFDALDAPEPEPAEERRAASIGGVEPPLSRRSASIARAARATRPLAVFGLRLLASAGWGLVWDRCVRCGRSCDPAASACVDPAAGGLVCRSCGGARVVLRSRRRAAMIDAQLGDGSQLSDDDVLVAVELVRDALAFHTGNIAGHEGPV